VPDLKPLLTFYNVNLLLLQFYNMSMRWSSVEIFQQCLDPIFGALGFAFNLGLFKQEVSIMVMRNKLATGIDKE